MVLPDVMGQLHTFDFEDGEVEVRLPSVDKVVQDCKYDDLTAVATVGARFSVDHRPLEYEILQVDVIIKLGSSIDLSPDVLTVPANAYKLVPTDQQKTLDQMADEHGAFLERGFEHWLSVLRWVADYHRIGRKGFVRDRPTLGARLQEINSGKTVWIQRAVVVLEGYHRITIDEWNLAHERLERQEKPPIHIALKLEATEFLDIGDYRRSLIDLGVSCETFLRNSVLEALPSALDAAMTKFIAEANINQYVSHFVPSILQADAAKHYRKEIRPKLDSLFAKRNEIVHQGDSPEATAKNCKRFVGVLNDLFAFIPSNLASPTSMPPTRQNPLAP